VPPCVPYQKWYNYSMHKDMRLAVVFYRTEAGREPVREWLRGFSRSDKVAIGGDIKTVQYGWPLGMPVVRKLDDGLWECRSRLADGIARIIFTVVGDSMILLHGFVKKSQKTPRTDLATAKRRKTKLEQ